MQIASHTSSSIVVTKRSFLLCYPGSPPKPCKPTAFSHHYHHHRQLTPHPSSGLGLAKRVLFSRWRHGLVIRPTTPHAYSFWGGIYLDFCLSLASPEVAACGRTASCCAIARLSFILALSNPISIFTLINCSYWPSCLSGGEDPRRSLNLETMSLTRTIRVRAVAATT